MLLGARVLELLAASTASCVSSSEALCLPFLGATHAVCPISSRNLPAYGLSLAPEVSLTLEIRALFGSTEISLHSPQLQLQVAESQCLLRHFPFIGHLDDFHYR